MIKLIKSSFYEEVATKSKLCQFITGTDKFSMGEYCQKFEEAFSKKQGRKFSVFVHSGSMANLVLIQALLNLGLLKKYDGVGVSALTWSTNVMPIIQLGLIPIAVDCQQQTLNVSPKTLEKPLLSMKAMFLTNVLGFCDDIKEIEDMCKKQGVILLEDNCESLGSEAFGKKLGNFSLASTFSFFIGHHMSTIEGGMICTDNEDLYNMLLVVRAHGWDRNLSPTKQSTLRKKEQVDDFYAKYTFYDLAYNARPTEINGFIGCEQIQYWDEIVKKRAENFQAFAKAAEQNSDIVGLELNHMDLVSNFSMPLIFKNKESFEKYKSRFQDNEVEIRPIISGNISNQPFYKKYVKEDSFCDNAQQVHEQGFYFGNNPELTEKEVSLLCQLLKK